ncbi:hypothetical protein WG909_13675 [Peptostreptococcaceae bacterium AGR-M142]
MNEYTKVISLMGHYFIKEFKKDKKHKNKIREIREETVAKAFKEGNTKIYVCFEEKDKVIELDEFSDKKLIITYLGKKFI